MELTFICHSTTYLGKMEAPNAWFVLLIIWCILFLFTHISLPYFGLKLSTWQPTYLKYYHPSPYLITLHTIIFLDVTPHTTIFGYLVAYVSLISRTPTNYNLDPLHASFLATPPTTMVSIVLIFLPERSISLIISHSMILLFYMVRSLPQNIRLMVFSLTQTYLLLFITF